MRTLAHLDGAARVETDSMGSRAVPAHALWGVHTARALENFAISGRPISVHPELIYGVAAVKQAAARANRDLRIVRPEVATAIDSACQRILDGHHHDQFVVDVIQGGGGVSTDMNANEVIANLALGEMGIEPGHYDAIDPLDDVNRSQSAESTYPTAVRVAVLSAMRALVAELRRLAEAFQLKGAEHLHTVRVVRTQLSEALPITLAQELGRFSAAIREDIGRLGQVTQLLGAISLGSTAVAAHPRYAEKACRHLRAVTGLDLRVPVGPASDDGVLVQLAEGLKGTALRLSEISGELRLLAEGPRPGLAEIGLPLREAASSRMAADLPVILDVVHQAAYFVVGAHSTVIAASLGRRRALNGVDPVVADSLLQMIASLMRAAHTFRENCVSGITVSEKWSMSMAIRDADPIATPFPYVSGSDDLLVYREPALASIGASGVSVPSDSATGLLSPRSLYAAAAGRNHP